MRVASASPFTTACPCRRLALRAVRIFVVEAQGDPRAQPGRVRHFAVQAASAAAAIELVREAAGAPAYHRVEVVQQSDEFDGGDAGILAEGHGHSSVAP